MTRAGAGQPIEIRQPKGVSFRVDGHEVRCHDGQLNSSHPSFVTSHLAPKAPVPCAAPRNLVNWGPSSVSTRTGHELPLLSPERTRSASRIRISGK